MYDSAQPYLACYLLIRQEGKIAFVLRQNTAWMNGFYALPAGKVEKGEVITEAAIREAYEEVGIIIKQHDLKFIHAAQRIEETEWIDIYFEVLDYEGDVHNAEPDKHAEVAWLDPDDLPDNVVPEYRVAIERIQAGELYTETQYEVDNG